MAFHCCVFPTLLVILSFSEVTVGNYDLRYKPEATYLQLRPDEVLLLNCSLTFYHSYYNDGRWPDVRTLWKYNSEEIYNNYQDMTVTTVMDQCLLFDFVTYIRRVGIFNITSCATIQVRNDCVALTPNDSVTFSLETFYTFKQSPQVTTEVPCYHKVIEYFPRPEKITVNPSSNATSTVSKKITDTGSPTPTSSTISEVEKLKMEISPLNLTTKVRVLEKATAELPLSLLDVRALGAVVSEMAYNLTTTSMTYVNEKAKADAIVNMVETTSNVLIKQHVWEQIPNPAERQDLINKFTTSVEQMSLKLSQRGFDAEEFEVTKPMVDLKLVSVKEEEVQVNFEQEVAVTVQLKSADTAGDRAPKPSVRDRIVFVRYKGINRLFSNENSSSGADGDDSQVLVSDIIAATASRAEIVGRIEFLLHHNEVTREGQRRCAFWNVTRSSWDTNGCRIRQADRTVTSCECDHLTSFAVIMDYTGLTMEHQPIHKLLLSVITYSGCTLSIIVCLFAGLGYEFARRYAGKQPKRESKMTNIIYEVIFFSICAADFTFIVGINRTEHSLVCGIIAGLLHYFLLLQYEWMTVIGVFYVMVYTHPYHLTVVETHCRWLLVTLLVLPGLIVGISAIVGHQGFGSDQLCWLSTSNGVIWTFIGPLTVLLSINICLLAILIYLTERHSSSGKGVLADTDANKTWIMNRKTKYRYELIFAFALGVTWIFGYPQADVVSSVITSYIFSIFNSFQGIIVCAICGSWQRMNDGYVKFLNKHDRFADFFCPCLSSYRLRRASRSSSMRYPPSFSASPKDTQSSTITDTTKYPTEDSRDSVFLESALSKLPPRDSWRLRIKKIPYIDRDSVVDAQWELLEQLSSNS